MIIIPSNISISLAEDLPVLDITIACYQNYKVADKEKLSYELMLLASKGYKKGVILLDVLLRGFAEEYRKEFYKENFPTQVKKTIKEGIEAMAKSPSVEFETDDVKLKIPLPNLNFLGVIASKLKLPKLGKKKEETAVIDGQKLLTINEEMQKEFGIAMNTYFTYLMKVEFIPLVLNDENQTSKFHDRYLTILNEIDEASNLQFVKWLFPENDTLWDQIYQET